MRGSFRILLVFVLVITGLQARADSIDQLRSWAHEALNAELSQERPNLNMLTALGLPLVTDVQQTGNADSMALIERIVRKVTHVPVEERQCNELAAIHLLSRFFSRIDRGFTSEDFLDRVDGCVGSDSLFDLANALVFYCGHTDLNHEDKLPGGLERLLDAQQPDGLFLPEEGDAWYYLTSHALLAMHYCKADPGRIRRTHEAIERYLPQFQKIEFTDGLAESLIFLRWTGDPASGESSYIGYLRGRVAPNGGVCFRYSRDCEQHWQPVARVWQLFLEAGKR